MSHHHAHGESHANPGHIVPMRIYVTVFVTLVVLTFVTVWISRHDFGTLNIVVAMLVASVKAMLVALFFMHLKYEKPTTWLYAFFPILLLGFLLAGVFIDNPYRTDPDIYTNLNQPPPPPASIQGPAAVVVEHGH
ncbi:MAG: cytochrome C oxidase subunit IV family protein [Deltaproteobacteria bacterium]|nr:cytochrome C oxidase subunit IV family protein [Deltaproteobacteria bacterium]